MHPIKRAFLVVLFSIGTVGGFAHGFAHLGHCASGHQARREAFEARVADVCTRSAQRVYDERQGAIDADGAPAPEAVRAETE